MQTDSELPSYGEERKSLGHFNTEVVKIDRTASQEVLETQLAGPGALLRQGQVVAFPTETVYGLGANALDGSAARKIFLTKNRPMDNPLIVHISSLDMLNTLAATVSDQAKVLMDAFWPGPLTILFPKTSNVPDEVTCGQPTVAVRMPSHPIAKQLIASAKVPVAAPSANLSGRPSPTRASHVLADLSGIIPCVVDGGACDVGVESTVVDVNRSPPLVLRPGGITIEMLRKYIPTMEVYSKSQHGGGGMEEKPPTPGLKYRHYSPTAKVFLYEGNAKSMQDRIFNDVREEIKNGATKIGYIHTHPRSIELPADLVAAANSSVVIVRLGDEDTPLAVAQGLFDALRHFDDEKVDLIFMEGISEANEGLAVMNRARKAASSIVHV